MSDEQQIQLADVKADIEKAFEGWITSLDDDETEDPENLGDEAKDLNTSHARIAQFLKQTEADLAKLRAENADLREQLEALEATLEDEEAGAAETFDLWKLREAEASKLRSALGSIHAIATDLCRFNEHVAGLGIGVMIEVELIRDKAAEAIAENQVTDDTGATT